MRRASIGISAHFGWAATASVVVGANGLRVLRTDRIEIVSPDDRQAREPYHVAGGFEGLARVPQPKDPAASLRTGIARQQRLAGRAIEALAEALADSGHRIAFAGILESRGRRARSYEDAIGSHTQIHIEEGATIRASIAGALEAQGARIALHDRKALFANAAERFGQSEAKLAALLKAARPKQGSWRKEEQTAALAAWLSWK